jgi:dTDP-glucose pyrophosphorylase
MNEAVDLWRQAILLSDATIHQAIRNLNETAIKIVLIVNHRGEFEGTLSDGDIRRGILKGLDIHSPIASIIRRNPLVVPPTMNREMVVQLMMANKIQQIPVIDDNNALVGLHLWDELTTPVKRPNVMIIMAGGKGTRLLPHTDHCPKPMVQVAGKPMLQHIVERAKLDGFCKFVFAIHHLGHMIEEYFENGAKMDVYIEYVREETPLGTVGALALLHPRPTASFVVTNGDVLTDIHYGELLDFHNRHQASATMAVRLHEWQHPFGVVQTRGIEIVGFEEKPIARSHINAGIYALSPEALTELEVGKSCDMPTLFERLHAKGKRTLAYPMHEPWLDVGRPDDLVKANLQVIK